MRLYLSSYHLGNQPERFAALVGENKRTAVISNAADMYSQESKADKLPSYIEELKNIGLKGEHLDLRTYFGKQVELAAELSTYGAVWTLGGNAFLLRSAMFQSGFDQAIETLLQEDKIVYGGFSAGAVVAAPTLIGLEIVDPVAVVKEVYGAEPIWEGLNLVSYSIAPHYMSNHEEAAAVKTMVEFFVQENIPYKTLRDGQAIVVEGNKEEIVG
ncbi:Type 1 glutamine amidotransferase-like domain-containing protein [Acetobacteraceae bacterium]|nr:Type 1 glutamine amidotransferase-like domain-containing protein [Candidatus Parcubacteria bacterium]